MAICLSGFDLFGFCGLVFFGKEAQSLALVIYLSLPLTKNLNLELMSKISSYLLATEKLNSVPSLLAESKSGQRWTGTRQVNSDVVTHCF